MIAWNEKNDENPLQRHANIYHHGERYPFKSSVLAKCYGRPSKRLITEAVLIDELTPSETMNNISSTHIDIKFLYIIDVGFKII